MGRRRIHPKHKQTKPNWYQKEDDWGNFVFDWTLGLSKETWKAIFAIVIMILSVTLFLGFLDKAGVAGALFAKIVRHIFGGFGSYIFDIVFAYIGVVLLIPKNKYRLSEFVGLFLLIFSLPSFIHLFVPAEAAKEAARLGQYGGLIGYMISYPLRQAIGLFPAFLLSVAVLIISVLMIFDFSFANFFGLNKNEEENEGKRFNVRNGEAKVSVFETMRRKFFTKKQRYDEVKAPVMEVRADDNPVQMMKKDITWQYPPIEMLKELDEVANPGNIYKNAEAIQKCLQTFNIAVALGDANVGPTVTQYTMKPEEGVKLNQIVARQNDLALALSAKSIRIEAPIPGKNAVGIEIPNKVAAKVSLREILLAPQFKAVKSKLALALGRDVAGEPMAIDLEKMPHMLIAGATGSGKSVCINSIIASLLFNNAPSDLRLLLVDPKRVELTNYNGIPHLLSPVVTEVDKTVSALKWTVWEMERRYQMFSDQGKRNISAYNMSPGSEGKLPYIVVVIDELADLMATSAKEVEASIVRISQMARATGIHLIVATQRPSVDVLTGLIKANITSRIAFAAASQVDSRTILDLSGAEKLLGNGDMLFIGNGLSKPRRVQGCFVSDPELEDLVKFLSDEAEPQYNEQVLSFGAHHGAGSGGGGGNDAGEDDLYNEAYDTVLNAGKASASLLQRRLKVGYARAARLLDILEENGVIGPSDGAKPRDVLVDSSAAFGGGSHSNFNNFHGAEPPRDHNQYEQDN